MLDHLQPRRTSSVAFTSVRSYDFDPTPAPGLRRSHTRQTCSRRSKDDTDATSQSLSSSVRPGDCFFIVMLDHLQPRRTSSVTFTSVRSYDFDPTPACGHRRSHTRRTCSRRSKDDTDAISQSLSSSVRPGDCLVSARNSRSADDVRGPLSDHSSAKQNHMHRKEASRTTGFLAWSERKQPWSCSACTFFDENVLHLSCSVCGTQREKRFSETNLQKQNKPPETPQRERYSPPVDYQAEEDCQSTGRNRSLTKQQEIEEGWSVTLKTARAQELIKSQEELLNGYNSSQTSLNF